MQATVQPNQNSLSKNLFQNFPLYSSWGNKNDWNEFLTSWSNGVVLPVSGLETLLLILCKKAKPLINTRLRVSLRKEVAHGETHPWENPCGSENRGDVQVCSHCSWLFAGIWCWYFYIQVVSKILSVNRLLTCLSYVFHIFITNNSNRYIWSTLEELQSHL